MWPTAIYTFVSCRSCFLHSGILKVGMLFRTRKSPVEPAPESGAGDASGTKSRSAAAPYYDERYRDRRERDTTATDRDRDRDHRRDARH